MGVDSFVYRWVWGLVQMPCGRFGVSSILSD